MEEVSSALIGPVYDVYGDVRLDVIGSSILPPTAKNPIVEITLRGRVNCPEKLPRFTPVGPGRCLRAISGPVISVHKFLRTPFFFNREALRHGRRSQGCPPGGVEEPGV